MKKRDLWLVFLITFIPRCVILFQAYPFIYVSDETSAISVAALAAGHDWSNVVSNAGYYGIGYLFLFAPLFRIVKNPVYIYRIILLVSSIVVSASAPICYAVLHKFLKIESRVHKVIISSLCGTLNFFTVVQMSARNEEILYLLIWVMVYILCNILYYQDIALKRSINEVILLFLLIYSLTVHTRAVCFIIGVLLFDVAGRIFLKKEIVHKWSYFIIAAGYILTNLGLKWYQGKIWFQGTGNTSVMAGVEKSLSRIADFTNINLYLNIIRIIGGQIYTASSVSGGLFIISVFILVFYLFKGKYREDEKGKYIFIIGGMFLFCTFFTIGGQSITWLSGVTNGMLKYGEGVYVSSYRAFAYLRYMGCYVPPFVMCALVIAIENRKLLKNASSCGIIIICLLTLFWMKMILPYIYNSRMTYFVTLGGMKAYEEVTYKNWHRACLLALAIFMVGFLLIRIKKEHLYLSLVIILLTIERIYGHEYSTLDVEQRNYEKADAGYGLIQKMLHEKELQSVYVFDALSDTNQIFYLYQFLNYSVKIIPELPEDLESDMVLFCNKDLKGLVGENCYGAKLDKNEYVYCIGEEYMVLLENCGMNMQKWE